MANDELETAYAAGMFATPTLDKHRLQTMLNAEMDRTVKEKAEELCNNASPVSDGSTAEYYELPENSTQLQDLISYKNMNAQIGEVFRAAYRYGQCPHSDKLREAKKIKFYAEKEIERLEKYG